MKKQTTDELTDEQSLVKLYAELAGTTESSARGVFMYLSREGEERSETPRTSITETK